MVDKKIMIVLMLTAVILSSVAVYNAITVFSETPVTGSFDKTDKVGVSMTVKPARNANVGLVVHSIENEEELK